MNRKEFITQSVLGTAALATPLPLWAKNPSPKKKKITILHTNDQHSRIEPFSENSGRNSGKGGFAPRATLINQIRQQEEHVLLLDSGDIFQGTPYFNFFGGELEFKLMSLLNYDAATMGNHDFDNGLEGFEKVYPHANFDFICSNYDFSNTLLDGKTQKYKIIKKGGIKVGIFGLGIELEGLVNKNLYKETVFLDPIETAQEMTRKLKRKNCDLIICLSHLGYEYKKEPEKMSDIKLATATQDIDLILGGHTHTFLEKPVTHINTASKEVLINQVGWAGIMLGRIDFEFDESQQKSHVSCNQDIIEKKEELIIT